MTDIEKSFAYLHDNLPLWMKNVAEIEQKMVAMQSELAKAPISKSLPMKRRTGSVESIRDLDAIHEDSSTSGAAQQSMPTARKRKTASLLSGQASGPVKMRSRTMIVVHYDGQIQFLFEQLVRAIATGRNMLRKGKMAAKMDAMAALANSSDEDEDDALMSKIGYRYRTGLASMRARSAMIRLADENTPIERFDTTDKALEQAQALCEKAAHQSLREGDCRKELNGVTTFFLEVQGIAKSETARHAARREKEQRDAAHNTEELTPPPEAELEKHIIPTVVPAVIDVHAPAKVVDIEVDDEEDDDTPFVMPPIRLTSRV